jgi:hypothetical protein
LANNAIERIRNAQIDTAASLSLVQPMGGPYWASRHDAFNNAARKPNNYRFTSSR